MRTLNINFPVPRFQTAKPTFGHTHPPTAPCPKSLLDTRQVLSPHPKPKAHPVIWVNHPPLPSPQFSLRLRRKIQNFQEAVRMNELVSFKHLELFGEQHYINTKPSYIFRHSFLLLYGRVFFPPSKVFKGFMNGKYSKHCFLAEIKILVSPTWKPHPPASFKAGRREKKNKWSG